MPANKKHLSSRGQRWLKITAGLIGGFLITILFHNLIGLPFKEKGGIIITSAYTSFIMWAILMIVAFMFKNGWKIWGIYLILIISFYYLIITYR